MDGRAQLPVIKYLQKKFGVSYVDTITEAGVNRVLAENEDDFLIQNILKRINISIDKHYSKGIAIAGHYDCAGNPVSKEIQIDHIKRSVYYLKEQFNNLEIVGLWVDENWEVQEIDL